MSDSNRDNISPLPSNQKIVNPDGTPTLFMTRWAQERSIDISGGITKQQAIDLINSYELQAGTGIKITPDGKLTSDPTIALADTAVTPGTYGDATHSAKFTVDQQGRLIAASQVPISGGGGGGGWTLIDSHVTIAGESSFDFASIPQTFTHLMIIANAGSNSGAGTTSDKIGIQFNLDTAADYAWTSLGSYGAGTAFGINGNPDTAGGAGHMGSTGIAGIGPAPNEINIPNYVSAFLKSYTFQCGCFQQNVGPFQLTGSGFWNQTAAITDITLFNKDGNQFSVGSEFWLYGM